jgi:small subunit ribosomal protein S13
MARIAGIDLPKNKRGEIGLTYIFGIGRTYAQRILADCRHRFRHEGERMER